MMKTENTGRVPVGAFGPLTSRHPFEAITTESPLNDVALDAGTHGRPAQHDHAVAGK